MPGRNKIKNETPELSSGLFFVAHVAVAMTQGQLRKKTQLHLVMVPRPFEPLGEWLDGELVSLT
jgi:hypothetical protein